MKKATLKNLNLNKKAISSFNLTKTNGGALSRYPKSCGCTFTCEYTESCVFCETWASCDPIWLTDFCHQP